MSLFCFAIGARSSFRDFEILKMDATENRPFARIDVEQMRSQLPAISGGALKVWLSYLLRANRDGVAWPGTKVLSADTGMSASRASKLRNELLRDGWLVPVGCVRGRAGTFAAPRFRPVIPQNHRAAKIAHGEDAARQKLSSPYGENDSHRAAKIAHEVVPLKKNPSEVDGGASAPRGGSDFENPKMTERVKKFLGFWSKAYQKKYATDPTINWPAEMRRLRPIFERNQDAAIESAARSYLDDETDFTVGHPLGKFVSQFDRWRALGNASRDNDGDDGVPTVFDNRPPDWEQQQAKLAAERARKAAGATAIQAGMT
jgi:hypothetical protein